MMFDLDLAAFFGALLHFGDFELDGVQDPDGLNATQHFDHLAVDLFLLS